MTRWNELNSDEQEFARDAYVALQQREELGAPAEAEPRIGVRDLMRFVTDPDYERPPGFDGAVTRDARLRDNLDALLESGALCRFALAAVASSGSVDHREEGRFTVHVSPSSAMPGLSIVTIEIQSGASPAALFAQLPNGSCHRQALPPVEGGRLQILLKSDSPLLRALRDPLARITLR